MRKNRKLLTLIAFFAVAACVFAPVSKIKGSAEIIVPDDYEFEDTWDDSYLLDNLEGEQTIQAEGTPPTPKGEEGETSGGCSSSLTVGGIAFLLVPAMGAICLKKKKD